MRCRYSTLTKPIQMRQICLFLLIITITSACGSSGVILENELESKNYKEVIGALNESLPKADRYAMYPNGLRGIYEDIANTIKYPRTAIENNIQGKVIVEFIVEENGEVKEARVIQSVSDELDKEALRVISELGKWYPGYKDEKPVRVCYKVPINFNLN